MKTYKIGQFAKLVHRTVRTIQKWDTSGKLKAHRTITNQRYYTEDQVDQVLGISKNKQNRQKKRIPLSDKINQIHLKYFTGKNLITKLGEAEIICVILHDFKECDYITIAKLLNLPVNKVKEFTYRGKPLRYSNFWFMLPGSYMMNDIKKNIKYYVKIYESKN